VPGQRTAQRQEAAKGRLVERTAQSLKAMADGLCRLPVRILLAPMGSEQIFQHITGHQ
jgi:hypothetical protein